MDERQRKTESWLRTLLLLLAFPLLFAQVGCWQPEPEETVCTVNSDCQPGYKCHRESGTCIERFKRECDRDDQCVCWGVDMEDNSCFVGNIWYYQSRVDKMPYCPGFCPDETNGLVLRCVSGTCQILPK